MFCFAHLGGVATAGAGGSTTATFRYVDPAATGANNGTSWANAWTSLASASGVAPGTTVYISGGPTAGTQTYNLSAALPIPNGASGANRVTFQIGQDAAHNGTAIFNATTNTFSLIDSKSNITFSGDAGDGNRHFKLTGAFETSIFLNSNVNVRLGYIDFGNCGAPNWRVMDMRSVNGIEVDHCLIHLTNVLSDTFAYASFVGSTWDENSFHHNFLYLAATEDGNGADGLEWVGTGYSIYNNYIEGGILPYTGTSQHQDGWQDTGGSAYIKIYNNTWVNHANYAIFGDAIFGNLTHLWIYNNIVVLNNANIRASNPPQGIAVGPDGGAPAGLVFNDILIANNIVVDYGNHLSISLRDPVDGRVSFFTNCIVQNNIVVNSNAPFLDTAVTASANVLYSSAQAASRFVHYVLSDVNNDYHLTAAATEAINQGVNLSAFFTTDFSGTSRPSTGPWEIGPYEF